MSLGKAQKQRRNIDAKISKRKDREKRQRELIESLQDDRVYQINYSEHSHWNGILMRGKQIKEMHNIK